MYACIPEGYSDQPYVSSTLVQRTHVVILIYPHMIHTHTHTQSIFARVVARLWTCHFSLRTRHTEVHVTMLA